MYFDSFLGTFQDASESVFESVLRINWTLHLKLHRWWLLVCDTDTHTHTHKKQWFILYSFWGHWVCLQKVHKYILHYDDIFFNWCAEFLFIL